jgi:hypothetical protein
MLQCELNRPKHRSFPGWLDEFDGPSRSLGGQREGHWIGRWNHNGLGTNGLVLLFWIPIGGCPDGNVHQSIKTMDDLFLHQLEDVYHPSSSSGYPAR